MQIYIVCALLTLCAQGKEKVKPSLAGLSFKLCLSLFSFINSSTLPARTSKSKDAEVSLDIRSMSPPHSYKLNKNK